MKSRSDKPEGRVPGMGRVILVSAPFFHFPPNPQQRNTLSPGLFEPEEFDKIAGSALATPVDVTRVPKPKGQEVTGAVVQATAVSGFNAHRFLWNQVAVQENFIVEVKK